MAAGYIGLGFFQRIAFVFYGSLGLIIIGNGFFKPTISTILGNLLFRGTIQKEQRHRLQYFYMGINIGAFICNIIAAYMRNRFGWGEAFIAAGVGILIGLVIFSFGLKHIRHACEMKPAKVGDSKISDVLLKVFVPALIVGFIGWIIPGNIFGSDSTDAFIFACAPVVYFYISIYVKAHHDEKRSIGALLMIFLVCMFFGQFSNKTEQP